MKFAVNLSAQVTPEWRSQYVQYEEMKKFLYAAEEKAPPKEDVNEDILKRHFKKYEDGFFLFCDKELAKINTFFAEKLAEATRKYNELHVEIDNIGSVRMKRSLPELTDHSQEDDERNSRTGLKSQKSSIIHTPTITTKTSRNIKALKFAVTEFYLSLILIQNFQQLNFTGFRKILKKHDKLFQTDSGVQYRIEKVETSTFYINKQIDDLILETENVYINGLEGGDRGKAMNRLRVPPLSKQQNQVSSFFWGLFSGIFLVLLIILFISAYYKRPKKDWQPALRMYRGLFLIVIMTGMLGINLYGWNKAGVNHILIFELDPRDHLSYVDLLGLCSFFGCLLSVSGLAFLFSPDFHLPMFAHPLALACFMLAFLLNPTKTFHHTSRLWLLKIIFRIVIAPFAHVNFADFWLADQLNSMVVPMLDLQYLICFYSYDWYRPEAERQCTKPQNIIRPLVAILPAWWRLAQCLRRYKDTRQGWPHLVNAGKYSTSLAVTTFSTLSAIYKERTGESQNGFFFFIWLAAVVLSTFYSLFWDLRMDWGLFDKNAGENFILREEIVYDSKAYYYLAILADLIFRFTWTLTISVGEAGYIHNELFVLFIATGEVFRRFIWNFFRLENEHLNNCGQFRAVRDISIKPIKPEASDEMTIEQLMDHEEGPLPKNRVVHLLLTRQERGVPQKDIKISLFKISRMRQFTRSIDADDPADDPSRSIDSGDPSKSIVSRMRQFTRSIDSGDPSRSIDADDPSRSIDADDPSRSIDADDPSKSTTQ